MALALSVLSDILSIATVEWSIKRNDELSGLGDGRVWQAELSPPIWEADISLNPMYNDDAKHVAAMVRKLHGAQESFWLVDPLSRFPRADPDGSKLGNATVGVADQIVNRKQIALKGLPPGYVLSPGDKMQINFGANPERSAFIEVSSSVVADGNGRTLPFDVFPHLPMGIVADLVVTLAKPACKVFIQPESHRPGRAQGTITTGAGFTVFQRK